ncbi:MAG: ATP-binding protein [Phycisphaerales bacterium]|nr:ATP-binding protein [Phycisphaerales bacterium]
MACVQITYHDQLMKDWGIGANIAYGRGVTLMFSGPPGVGKTAAAEGLAKELAKPLLAVDYSEIQNCFVGETEKRIVSTFREATRRHAVLFWDEADAMFYNRDDGGRSWEIREVNVLLRELEKFEGVCILATNRKAALDAALERRITLKVNFERPTADMRRHIWAKLVPATMPVADDVNYDVLSEHDLSGGEIKNVVLNAARSALLRSPTGPVTLADFQEAIHAEQEGRLQGENRPRMGFLAAH